MDIGITSIDGDSFTPMSLLKDIKIRNNIHLNTIDQRTFSGVTDSVEFLEIDNNNLNDKLSLEFLRNENWTVLSHLNIGYNFNLRDLPSEIFSKTPALAYLQCQDIGLTSINKDMFSGLASLHTLDLAYNNIRTITPQTFKNSPSLVELRLHDQQSIDYLDIQNNAFSGIETSLEMLSLQNNKLNVSQFWMDLSTLTNLLVLEVDNTGIENIPNRAFRNNVKLTNLHIADNKITSLKQETFFGPRDTLQTIYINRNKIQTVDQCTLSDFPVRPKLILVGNPLNCNCDLAWLYDWFKLQCNQTQETVACQEIGQCASPVSLTNKNFTEFNKNEMCPTGATIRNCPDIYLTTTTKTTTSRTTTTTTPICTTPALPQFEILINKRASTFIEVTWVINDRTHVTGLKLEMISNYQSNKEAYPGLDAKSHTFYQLREDTTFTFCLVLKIENEYRDTQPKCKSTTTLPPLTESPSSTTTVAPEKISVSFSSTILGVVIGGIVVILMFTLFIGIFIYYRLKKHLTLSEPPNLTVRNNLNQNKTEEFDKTSSKDNAIEQYDMSVISSSSDYFCQCTASCRKSSDVNEGSLKADSVLSTVGNYSDNVRSRRSSNPVDHSRLSVSRGVPNVGFVSSTDSLEKF
jgi:Leucine-rich repeat (LRR) protein